MNSRFNKIINSLIVFSVLLAVFLWTTIRQNASSNVLTSTAEVDFLDVGQGDAILINLPDSIQALIDGGRDSRVLGPLSRHMPKFDKKIEYVFATHPDADHIGGLPDVMRNYQVGEFVETGKESSSQVFKKINNIVEEKKIPVKQIRQGDEIKLSAQATMEVLWPDENAVKLATTNNSSEVMRFNYQGATVMLTGDAEVEAQDKIMASQPKEKIKSDILKVAHHGAASGYDKKFLEEVGSEYAVISVGKDNPYGHPSPAVIAALNTLGEKIFRTDEVGTVSFVWQNGKWVKK